MSENILCDIVVLPNSPLKNRALTKSRELEEQGSYFILGNDTCVPHVSLYMLQIAASDLTTAESVLLEIAAAVKPLQLDASRPYHSNGYVDVEYQRFDGLDNLQMEVVRGLTPMRNGMYIDEIERMKIADGLKLENLQQYGYQNIGELFRPHMTFTRLKSETDFKLDNLDEFSGMFTKLGVFELGDNGTCARTIATFNFSS